jgi:hypothetical protein
VGAGKLSDVRQPLATIEWKIQSWQWTTLHLCLFDTTKRASVSVWACWKEAQSFRSEVCRWPIHRDRNVCGLAISSNLGQQNRTSCRYCISGTLFGGLTHDWRLSVPFRLPSKARGETDLGMRAGRPGCYGVPSCRTGSFERAKRLVETHTHSQVHLAQRYGVLGRGSNALVLSVNNCS